SAPVVQNRPSGVESAAPAAWRGVSADRALDDPWLTNRTLAENACQCEKIPVPATILEYREHPTRAIAGGDHPIRLGLRQGHDLVHDAILSCVEDAHGELGMRVVRGRDHEQPGRRILEGVLEGGISTYTPS